MTHSAPQRRAFTLIEVLVTVGIIVIVSSLAVVVYSRAMSAAGKATIGYQLQTIQLALEAYKTEFNAFPTTTLNSEEQVSPVPNTADDKINASGLRGARTLCKALMGQTPQGVITGAAASPIFNTNRGDQDGGNGFGFRVPSRSGVFKFDQPNPAVLPTDLGGKVYGPYLAPDKFRVANTNIATVVNDIKIDSLNLNDKNYDDTAVLLDANNRPILYYPVLNPQPNVTLENTYIGQGPRNGTLNAPLPMYRFTDNSTLLPEAAFKQLLGDTNQVGASNGAITGTEVAAVKGKPILWSSGPDGFYGYNTDPLATAKAKKNLDDVTNFDQ